MDSQTTDPEDGDGDNAALADNICNACELVMEAQGRDLLQPHLKDLKTMLVDLASFGASKAD